LGSLKVIESGTIISADPENLTIELNITTIGKPIANFMVIFVYPRRPPAAILDLIELQIAPFDPPTPKTLV